MRRGYIQKTQQVRTQEGKQVWDSHGMSVWRKAEKVLFLMPGNCTINLKLRGFSSVCLRVREMKKVQKGETQKKYSVV